MIETLQAIHAEVFNTEKRRCPYRGNVKVTLFPSSVTRHYPLPGANGPPLEFLSQEVHIIGTSSPGQPGLLLDEDSGDTETDNELQKIVNSLLMSNDTVSNGAIE
jgi:hypothetical protein